MARYKLSEVVMRIKDKVDKDNTELEYYIGGEHFDNGEICITKRGIIKESTIGPAFHMRFKPGDVLLMSRNPHLRKAGVVDFEGICSDVSYVCRTRDENVLMQRFLPFIFQTDAFWKFAEENKGGSTNFFLNWSDFERYEFNLPSIEEQRQLTDILWAAQNAKLAYKELLRQTDELVKSQFIELFGDPILHEKGWPSKSIKESAVRLSDGPFGSNLKSDHYSETGVRVIRLQNICEGYFLDDDKAYVSLEHYEKIKKYTCKSGEIIIGTLGEPNLRACIIPEYIGYAINKADCVHYIPNPEYLDTAFVVGFLNSPIVLNYALGDAHGNTRQRISSGQISKMPIIIPPMELQKQYAVIIQQTDKSKYYEQNHIFSVARGGELCA